MRKLQKNRHFSSYILEHLVGVFVLFFIAVTLSIIGRSVGDARSDLLALTFFSTPVSFSAEKLDVACVNDTTQAKYHFTITPEQGGYVTLNTPTGIQTIDSANGLGAVRVLSVGSYTWTGTQKVGFMGTSMGGFVVENVCAQLSNSVQSQVAVVENINTVLPTVEFSPSVTTNVNCQTGKPMTDVSLVVTDANGGEYVLSSDTGMSDAHYKAGIYAFANGTYSWKADVTQGYTGVGILKNVFSINNACASALPILSPAPEPVKAVVATDVNSMLSAPNTQVRLFVDNKPVDTNKTFDGEQLEIRVTTVASTDVDIIVTNGIGTKVLTGDATKDDLLSKPGSDVWSYVWNLAQAPNGTLKLVSRVQLPGGKFEESEPTSINIQHSSALVAKTLSPLRVTSTPTSPDEKNAILTRVSDPASCGNASECLIYCKSTSDESSTCEKFVQTAVTQEYPTQVSLANDISDERLMQMLTDAKKRSKELPEIVQDPESFKQFCGDTTHIELCSKILTRNDLSAPDTLLIKKEELLKAKEENRQLLAMRVGARAYIDTDNDGVSDFDEVNIYFTNPSDGDTDGDGFQDGAELLSRTNPRGGMSVGSNSKNDSTGVTAVSDESVKYENPTITGEVYPKLLAVKSVEVVGITQDETETTTATKLKFEGIAPPNSFVTLHIFSDPIVVTVKVDAMGSWTYTFDKELPDGTHQVYSTITNNEGHILAKSEPLPFVKVASAVSLGSSALIPDGSQTGFFSGNALYALLAMVIGALGVALSVVGFVAMREGKDEISIEPPRE